MDAYVRDGDESTCLIYAVNQDGVYGWYRYDVQDRTYMRYTEEAAAEDTQQAEPSTEQSGSQMKDLESQMRLLFYAFIVVVAILLIVIVRESMTTMMMMMMSGKRTRMISMGMTKKRMTRMMQITQKMN